MQDVQESSYLDYLNSIDRSSLSNYLVKIMRKTHYNEEHNVIERIKLLARRRKVLQI